MRVSHTGPYTLLGVIQNVRGSVVTGGAAQASEAGWGP